MIHEYIYKAGQKKKELELLQIQLRNMIAHSSIEALKDKPEFIELRRKINNIRKDIMDLRKEAYLYIQNNEYSFNNSNLQKEQIVTN